jgi:hypothetical protein
MFFDALARKKVTGHAEFSMKGKTGNPIKATNF